MCSFPVYSRKVILTSIIEAFPLLVLHNLQSDQITPPLSPKLSQLGEEARWKSPPIHDFTCLNPPKSYDEGGVHMKGRRQVDKRHF